MCFTLGLVNQLEMNGFTWRIVCNAYAQLQIEHCNLTTLYSCLFCAILAELV